MESEALPGVWANPACGDCGLLSVFHSPAAWQDAFLLQSWQVLTKRLRSLLCSSSSSTPPKNCRDRFFPG